MNRDMNRDELTVVLRNRGRSYLGIAGKLEFDSARATNTAFNRALRGRPNVQQAWLRSRAAARLDAAASRMRGRDDLSVQEIVRRLHHLQHQRKTLFVA